MKRTMTAFVTATALSMAAVPPVQAMEMEFNMLTGAVHNAFVQLNLPTERVHDLTLSQIGQIMAVINDQQANGIQKSRIQAILDQS